MPVLTRTGHFELAVELIQSRDFPSWLYPVMQGATKVWERWDGYTKAHGFQNPRMNSFNHYAFGAVSEWMIDTLAGIRAGEPGFGTIIIKPHIPLKGSVNGNPPLNEVSAGYRSIHGKIESAWQRDGREFSLDVSIPANTAAEIHLPADPEEPIRINGGALDETADIKLEGVRDRRIIILVPGGEYSFTYRLSERAE